VLLISGKEFISDKRHEGLCGLSTGPESPARLCAQFFIQICRHLALGMGKLSRP